MRAAIRTGLTSLGVLVGSMSIAQARTAVKPWTPPRVFDFKWFQKNQWRLPITNYATFGYGIGRSGGEWPAGSGDMYIYGAGIWIGTLRTGPAGRDTLVSVGYNPNSGKSEMTPSSYDHAPGEYSDQDKERVYIYPEDWPPNPEDFSEEMRDSIRTPLQIPSGDTTIPGYFYFVPRTAVSSGDAWAVFSDRDPELHVAGGGAIGVEVYQSTYAWTLPWNQDIVFFKLDVRNRTSEVLTDVYLGMVCDADVGNATDDRCGLALSKYIFNPSGTDSVFVDNMGYVWSEEPVPSGLVGFDFLQSPYVRNPNGSIDGFNGLDDSAPPWNPRLMKNGLIDEPAEGRQLGMTAFKIFTLTDADPQDDFEQYLCLAGYDYANPEHPYNPYDSTDQAPADKRFLQSTGPFTLEPDSIATVTIGLIGADRVEGGGPAMTYNLALASRAAQAAYDNNWIMPEPPPSPTVTAIPGDARVTLVWDDVPEDAKDRFYPVAPALLNPHYVEQDFQGYKVYRSRTGQPGDWQLLTQFDRIDGIRYEDTVVVESLRTKATEAGLAYCFADSSDLRLGFPYYYAVTSFDVNYLGDTLIEGDSVPKETLSLESGLSAVRTVPRTQPVNYKPPKAEWFQVAGNRRLELTLEPFAVSPHAVRNNVYRIQFIEPGYDAVVRQPKYRFLVTDQEGDTVLPLTEFGMRIDTVTDTIRFVPTVFDSVITLIQRRANPAGDSVTDTTRAWLPVVQMTMDLHMGLIPNQFYDRVVVVSGSYPEESLTVAIPTENKALWAYRGSNFRIVWKDDGSGRRTCEVYDLENERDVPYRNFGPRASTQDSADGWCFRTLRDASSNVVVDSTWQLYVCGSQFQFRPRGPILATPEPGDTWILYTRNLSPAPSFSAFEVRFEAMELTDTVDGLDVKVVPNPYLVRNEWERHPDFRRLKFINLPNHCTIRIYNLAGDLIRTLQHDNTKPEVGGLPNQYGGDEDWDLLNESRQKPAPGIYIFHVESDQGNQVGKFVVIH